ncbi:MAG: TerB N-terminal domain-containing protein [Halioglobus sp.]|nr:TerB N-terminal domain-containing protein [Halioglobus sp.]
MEILFVILIVVVGFAVAASKSRTPAKHDKPKDNTGHLITVKGPASVGGNVTRRDVARSRRTNHTEDDRFSNFGIGHRGQQEEETRNKTPGKWVLPGESASVGTKEIKGGFIYFGGQLTPLGTNHGVEAALVDNSLALVDRTMHFSDETLNYWPKYSQLSPACRGAYVDWLASDRNDPEVPLGYVFLYFYGIERRLLLDYAKDEVSDEEVHALYREIVRLRFTYGEKRSFWEYSTRLLEYLGILAPHIAKPEILLKRPARNSLLFRYQLARCVSEGRRLPATLGLTWIKNHQDYRLRTAAKRCGKEFDELFIIRYTKEFGDGLLIKPNKSKLRLDYRPASGTLWGFSPRQYDLPDPSALKGPTNKLIEIAERVTEEISPYSRFLSKSGNSRDDIPGKLLLPDDLIQSSLPKALQVLSTWLDDKPDDILLINVSEFFDRAGIPIPSKINKRESELLVSLASTMGYGLAPDIRYHKAKPLTDGVVALFRGGHSPDFHPSLDFLQVGMILRLGAMVATVDGEVDEAEEHLLETTIESNASLSDVEKLSLRAYMRWRLNTPADMTGLKRRLATMGPEAKQTASHILISVALADNAVATAEIKHLEQLYTALGLDKSRVTGDIHAVKTSSPLTSMTGDRATPTQQIPVLLDIETLKLHQAATDDVQSMLSAIFEDDIGESEPVGDPPPLPSSSVYAGLDPEHAALYEQLIEKAAWSRDEMEAQCNALGLMIDGAIETLNDWAFDTVDAPVIDEDGDILVDADIVDEISEKLEQV